METYASQSHDLGQPVGGVRDAERVCQDATGAAGASDLRLAHFEHDAPSAGLSEGAHSLDDPAISPPASISNVAATQQAQGLRRTLQIFVHGERVGNLHNDSGVWSFCYARLWTRAAGCRALTGSLPLQNKTFVDTNSMRPVQKFFEGLLPDSRALASLAELAHIDETDSFALLAYCGAKSAGYHLGDYPNFVQFGPPPGQLAHRLALNAGERTRNRLVRKG